MADPAPATSAPTSADGWEVVEQAAQLARRGEAFALATVVWRQGPSSGQQGSRAIVTPDGALSGWIGGACAEPVVIREAQRAISDQQSRLLLLGSAEQFGEAVPQGMTAIPIACQSEGAMEVYIEPVVPTPQLVVAGRSPMAHTLVEMARALGWAAELLDGPDFVATDVDPRAAVVVATQGHGDEEAVAHAVAADPVFVGVVASRTRATALREHLADQGVDADLLDRMRVPVGLDLGHTSHREIAVAILAELVQLRAAGSLATHPPDGAAAAPTREAIDPVCGMTVSADDTSRPLEHDGVTYHFCCPGCRAAFEKDPASHLTAQST